MEIVKRGERPEDHTRDAKCSNCKTEMRYKPADTRVHTGTRVRETSRNLHYDDWSEHTIYYTNAYRFIVCPVCGKQIKIEEIGDYTETYEV